MEHDRENTPDRGTDRDAALRGLEETFGTLLRMFRYHIAELAEATSPGLLPGTYKVLTSIEAQGPLSVSSLAEHLEIDKGQASRAVSELEVLGFIDRTEEPEDRRVRIIAISDLATERLASARVSVREQAWSHLREWPVDSIEHLSSLLQSLTSGQLPPDRD